MASNIVSAPGTQHGPCLDCDHPDCRGLRNIAAATCGLCAQPIGYERRFYQAADKTNYLHAVCIEHSIKPVGATGRSPRP